MAVKQPGAAEIGPGRPTPLELASGTIRGVDAQAPAFPVVEPLPSTRAAFERVVLSALQRPPCVVSFSGGRDSSAILAVAAHVARREGLPMPVPVTLRFPEDPASEEDSWQELVLRHLRIEDRVTLSFTDELEVLGPYARETLRTQGLLWPANSHLHIPIAEQARGGTVLTGFGGDELLTPNHLFQRANLVLTRQVRPHVMDGLRLAAFFGPQFLRRAAMRRHMRGVPPRPWLRPGAQRAVEREEIDDLVAEPLPWDRSLERWWRARYRILAEASLDRVMAMRGAAAGSPFADPLVLTTMAREGGRVGFPSRTDAMLRLFGDLLPGALSARATKASFSRGFASSATTSFARDWDGSGVDDDLVDPEVLRRLWTGDGLDTDFRASLLIQSAWLASDPDRSRADGPEPR